MNALLTRMTKVYQAAKKVGFELTIIFLGVYGAFWVDNYRDERAETQRSLEVAQALQRDLDDFIEVQQRFNEQIAAGLSEWERAQQQGDSPPPFYFRARGAEHPPITIYETVQQSGLAGLFDAELMFDLGYFYSEVSGVGDRYVRYAIFTENEILPRLKTGPTAFYSTDGQSLLPRFEAHMDRLREFVEFWDEHVQMARELTERLSTEP